MKVAKAKGRLCGKQPKLKPNQAKHLLELHDSGAYTQAELAELFGVGRSTIYRTIQRMRSKSIEPERPFADRAIVAEHANQRSAEISADRVMRPADFKQEAPTSVGASSSGTACSRGGNSC
jgi:predicted DNA-binding transcriptional regulator YafY